MYYGSSWCRDLEGENNNVPLNVPHAESLSPDSINQARSHGCHGDSGLDRSSRETVKLIFSISRNTPTHSETVAGFGHPKLGVFRDMNLHNHAWSVSYSQTTSLGSTLRRLFKWGRQATSDFFFESSESVLHARSGKLDCFLRLDDCENSSTCYQISLKDRLLGSSLKTGNECSDGYLRNWITVEYLL